MIQERFKTAIKSKGMDYKEVSKILGISYNKVNGMACGKQKITNKIAFLMEYYLDIDPFWLMFGIGNMVRVRMDLGNRVPFDEKQDFDLVMEKRVQSELSIREEIKTISPTTVTKTDDEILLELLNKVANKEFKKGILTQLKMIEELKK